MGYWEDRQAATQANLTKRNIAQTQKQLEKYYATTQRRIIGQFQQTYNKLLSTIEEGRAPTPADLYKLDTYWQMQAQLRDELTKLGNKQAEVLSKNFINEYINIYEALAAKDGLYFNTIDTKTAEAMINHIWCADGKNWSSRIWNNTDLLQQALNDNLIECVVAGRKSNDLIKLLEYQFGVSYNRAESLVRTEMAHIQTEAAKQRYLDAGVKEVQIWADEDERRCEVCGKLHEKIYPAGAAVPIPAHPRCRCCIIPVV